jgi:osmotically-inducible protein OsmY
MVLSQKKEKVMYDEIDQHQRQRRLGGHLPPPFYSAQTEYPRRQYLAEPGFRESLQTSNQHQTLNRISQLERANAGRHLGFEGDYRHHGDRRQDHDPDRAWQQEYPSRHGYRRIKERIELERNYRGKGPRSYRRSDERILEDLNEQLYEDPFLDASDIETSVSSGEVVLSGSVQHRNAKRRAEDIAERISGVTHVENRLRIIRAFFRKLSSRRE